MCNTDTCPMAKRIKRKRLRELKKILMSEPCPGYVNKNGVSVHGNNQ